MPQVMIPPLGTVMELQEAWTFPLHYENRNKSLGTALGIRPSAPDGYDYWGYDKTTLILPDGTEKKIDPDVCREDYDGTCPFIMDVTLPAGSILRVDRIYIRRGAGDFDSVSFYLKECPDKALLKKKTKGARFWAKLADVNKMVVEYLS